MKWENAREAYKAINSEANMGLKVIGFVSTEPSDELTTSIDNVPVIKVDADWLSTISQRMQFIVAVESDQSNIRNNWLREFMIRGSDTYP